MANTLASAWVIPTPPCAIIGVVVIKFPLCRRDHWDGQSSLPHFTFPDHQQCLGNYCVSIRAEFPKFCICVRLKIPQSWFRQFGEVISNNKISSQHNFGVSVIESHLQRGEKHAARVKDDQYRTGGGGREGGWILTVSEKQKWKTDCREKPPAPKREHECFSEPSLRLFFSSSTARHRDLFYASSPGSTGRKREN